MAWSSRHFYSSSMDVSTQVPIGILSSPHPNCIVPPMRLIHPTLQVICGASVRPATQRSILGHFLISFLFLIFSCPHSVSHPSLNLFSPFPILQFWIRPSPALFNVCSEWSPASLLVPFKSILLTAARVTLANHHLSALLPSWGPVLGLPCSWPAVRGPIHLPGSQLVSCPAWEPLLVP